MIFTVNYSFRELLLLVLFNNVFSYHNFYFLQIAGIAMGSICGPTLANIYVFYLESKWLSLVKPLVYKRFIDDVFIIIHKDFNLQLFLDSFLPLKLNIVINNSVIFLDLFISINQVNHFINFKLYIKPTNTFSYLFTTSNHPNFIFKNIPKSLLIRIRRICSYFSDYLYFSGLLISQLISRGYNYKLLRKIQITVGLMDRNSLLPYNNSALINKNKTIFFKLPFDKNLSLSSSSVVSINNFFSNHKFLYNYNVKLVYSVKPNISQLLVHSHKFSSFKPFYNKRCLSANCVYCKFIDTSSNSILINNLLIPIYSTSDCTAKNLIYIIKCLVCNMFYIGETTNFKSRFSNHLSNIKNFRPYCFSSSCVSKHFNLKEHNHKIHLKILIFKDNINDDFSRLRLEAQLINLVKNINPLILINDDIPFKKSTHVPLLSTVN